MLNVKKKPQTPLMRQYWDIKSMHPDKILFFRMGDFYEMFHEDAITAAPILGIALTSRNKSAEDQIPMCGVPHHSLAKPLNTLLSAGYRVALCDQLEDPKQAKGIVKRGVTRIFSPGIVYDPDLLEGHTPHFLVAYCKHTISFLDTTTGDAFYYEVHDDVSKTGLREHLLNLINPVEMILTQEQKEQNQKRLHQKWSLTVHNAILPSIPSTGIESNDRLLSYLVSMQGKQALLTLRPFEKRVFSRRMKLSHLTIEHLELFSTYKGSKQGSLFHVINQTKSPLGARKLRSWLTFPLISPNQIRERQEQVERWMKSPHLMAVRNQIASIGDMQRRIGRISTSNCQAHDLLRLADSLSSALKVFSFVDLQNSEQRLSLEKHLSACQTVEHQIKKTLKSQAKGVGFIQKGISKELDELLEIISSRQDSLLKMETREKQALGIPNLKIRYNNVFGYYIEVTNTHKDKIPSHYVRKQTLVNAERYLTSELQLLESKILSARSKCVQLEKDIFHRLRISVLEASSSLLVVSDQIAQIDVFSALAWLALESNYVRSDISENEISLISSRHPVVEKQTGLTTTSFVPNDIVLNRSECFLITGPNMAGKSTLMRQVALSAILMQMGSFVPASRARLPLFDQIQTRIGASDVLAEGLSTFMLEMKETAQMLKNSTNQTLVILDEVGRGTSTFDGMSLAQAILEYLMCHVKTTTFFATHYHELTQVADQYPHITNKYMKILEDGDQITFLYQLTDGLAKKSYGIHVAKLAGLPEVVIRRAERLLQTHSHNSSAHLPSHIAPTFQNRPFNSQEALTNQDSLT